MTTPTMARRQPISQEAFGHLCEIWHELNDHGFVCNRSILASAIILSVDKDHLIQDFLALVERKVI